MALGILAASEVLQSEKIQNYGIIGELSLDGSTRPARGILPMAIAAQRAGLEGLLVPVTNAEEAAVVADIKVIGVETLYEAVEFLTGNRELMRTTIDLQAAFKNNARYGVDYDEVKGQEHVKRAMEIAAAGNHNILMLCPI